GPWVPPLKPDLLGIMMVLERLRLLRHDGDAEARALIMAAWAVWPHGTAQSARRALEDFPEHEETAQLLLTMPQQEAALVDWSAIVPLAFKFHHAAAGELLGALRSAYEKTRNGRLFDKLVNLVSDEISASAHRDRNRADSLLRKLLSLPLPNKTAARDEG